MFMRNQLKYVLISVRGFIRCQSTINLGRQMKMLNDRKEFEAVLRLFDEFKENHSKQMSSMVITQTLKACTQLRDLKRGRIIYDLVSSRLNDDCYISASLINLFMKSDDLSSAKLLFERSKKKSLSMYGAMMKGYILHRMANEAIELFKQIEQPDPVIVILALNACAQLASEQALTMIKQISSKLPQSFYSNPRLLPSLIDAFMKCGETSVAQSLFDRSNKKVLSLYGAMIKGYVTNHQPKKAIETYQMAKKESYWTDENESTLIIHLCVINAAAQLGLASMSQSIVEEIPRNLLKHRMIQNALIDMWGKAGRIDKAEEIFKNISQPDQIGYTSMINAYGLNGIGIEAVELYNRLSDDQRNDRAHVCVLNACSHSGLIQTAQSIFANIRQKNEQIYTIMVDCFSRGGYFDEAEQLINQYENDHLPSLPMYMAILSGARNEKNSNRSKKIFECIEKKFPESNDPLTSASILLANTYASSGDIEKASDIRNKLYQSGLKRQVALSWTIIDGHIFEFTAHDRSHHRSTEIYRELDRISNELVDYGHQYDSRWIVRPMKSNETVQSILCGHSERLAIALNFLENPYTKRIQITKNLRVCGDCHQTTKLIAKIRQCEIIVRDANRIHHFHVNGQCSCQDYF